MTIAQGLRNFTNVLETRIYFCLLVIVVFRVWFIYPHSRIARFLAISALVICFAGTVVFLGLSFQEIHAVLFVVPGVPIIDLGCTFRPPSNIWRIFLPVAIIHTILYVLTAYRGLRNRSITAATAPVVKRLVRE